LCFERDLKIISEHGALQEQITGCGVVPVDLAKQPEHSQDKLVPTEKLLLA